MFLLFYGRHVGAPRKGTNMNFKKLAVVAHVLQTTQNLVISRYRFAEDGKEMYNGL